MNTYAAVLHSMYARQALRGMKLGLPRVRALLDALDAPDAAYRSVLVAGTNGKGSTCAMTAALCQAAGIRVGLYTSPHLCRFTERITVNGVEVEPAQVVALHARALAAAARVDVEPTFFELTTAMALCHFAQMGVALAVLEVGLGGRLDATNAVMPAVCGLTPIDLDHQIFLGNTVQQIAVEKAGILRAGVPAWSAPQSPLVAAELSSQAALRGTPLAFVGPHQAWEQPLGLAGPHQRLNAALALKLSSEVEGLPLPQAVGHTLAAVRWPGRLEWLTDEGGGAVLLDGAHNPQGAAALAAALRQDGRVRSAVPVVWVVAASGGRDAGALLASAAWGVDGGGKAAVATQARVTGATPAQQVAASARAAGFANVHAEEEMATALRRARALAGPEGAVVVMGSLYAVGLARGCLTGEPVDPVALAG